MILPYFGLVLSFPDAFKHVLLIRIDGTIIQEHVKKVEKKGSRSRLLNDFFLTHEMRILTFLSRRVIVNFTIYKQYIDYVMCVNHGYKYAL